MFESYPNNKNSQLGPQKLNETPKIKSKFKVRTGENKKAKNYTEIESISKVRNERIIENESFSNTWVSPKTFFDSYPDPKKANKSPQKSKMTP